MSISRRSLVSWMVIRKSLRPPYSISLWVNSAGKVEPSRR